MGKRYHHGDLREALLDALLEEVAASGVDRVKVSALARRCGVSSAAPFKHFSSREALLVAAAERAADQQIAAMQQASQDIAVPLDAQRAQGVAYVRWAVENPGGFKLLSESEIIAASERLQAQAASFRDQLNAAMSGRKHGTVTPALTQRSASALAGTALVYGLAKMLVDGILGDRTPAEAEQIAREVLSARA